MLAMSSSPIMYHRKGLDRSMLIEGCVCCIPEMNGISMQMKMILLRLYSMVDPHDYV